MNLKSKTNLISEYCNLIFFWFLAVSFFSLFRVFFVLINIFDIESSLKISEYFKAFFMGFRFDNTVISYFILLPLLSAFILIPFDKVNLVIKTRLLFQKIFVVTSVFITVITLNFYEEYEDQFNHFLFVGLYDDRQAVFQSILREYHPILNAFLIVFLIWFLLKVFNYYEKRNKIYSIVTSMNFKNRDLTISILILILFFGSIRGSFTKYPARRFYASVTSDDFINKTILNPFKSLENAITDFKEINKTYDKNPFGPIPLSISKNHLTINEVLKKKVGLELIETKPKQVFLIIMESYDSWPLMEKYTDLKISTRLSDIQQKGIRFVNFLPSSSSTMNSFGSIITNVPYFGKNIGLIGSNKSFPSSIFEQFKTLGYQTNFFYGGYLSWQNINKFTQKQGADNIYGAGDINAEKGVWGVDDESLFEAVLKEVDTTKNSLNVILTLSYHPPYEVDVYAEGFQHNSLDDLGEKYNSIYEKGEISLNALGHLWYADKALGDFVSKAENKYSSPLFAFTGDHYGRKFINRSPTLYEKSSVPFILYGKSITVQSGLVYSPGSHIDITPTLLELIAPPGHTYYSFGNSLLKKSGKNKIGISFNKTIDASQVLAFSKDYGIKRQALPNYKYTKVEESSKIKKKHDSLMSLAWHYIIKGDTIDLSLYKVPVRKSNTE